jgi:hypothetical protein
MGDIRHAGGHDKAGKHKGGLSRTVFEDKHLQRHRTGLREGAHIMTLHSHSTTMLSSGE